MKTSRWAKLFGWAQFVLVAGGQLFGGGIPKNWREWLTLIASGFVGVATHHASNTDGKN